MLIIMVAGYFGFVPGISAVFGSNKPRDLGVVTSVESYSAAAEKLAIIQTGDPITAEKIQYQGSHHVEVSLTSEEISSLIANGKWKYNPISEGFQVKISPEGNVQVAGMLNRTRLDGYLKTNGFSEVLAYTSKFNVLPEKIPFALDGKASVVNNKVDLVLSKAEIGRVPLPTDAESVQYVERFVERRMTAVPGLNVQSLDFKDGKMNFTGSFPSTMGF